MHIPQAFPEGWKRKKKKRRRNRFPQTSVGKPACQPHTPPAKRAFISCSQHQHAGMRCGEMMGKSSSPFEEGRLCEADADGSFWL